MNVFTQKLKSRQGFTLLELLIVLAILVILTAVSIPLFSGILEQARETTDLSNVRTAYMEVITAYAQTGELATRRVTAQQTKANWDIGDTDGNVYIGSTEEDRILVPSSTVGWIVTATENGDAAVQLMPETEDTGE